MLPALIGGGLSLLGGVLGNRASAKQAAQQMAFQERMATTQHQREVEDLRAAGLNPILSGTGGMGSAVPGGAAAPQSDVLTPAVNSALAGRRNKAEVSHLEASARNQWYQGTQANLAGNVIVHTEDKEREAARREKALADEAEWNASSARWLYETAKAQGRFDEKLEEYGPGTRFLLEILRGVRPSPGGGRR